MRDFFQTEFLKTDSRHYAMQAYKSFRESIALNDEFYASLVHLGLLELAMGTPYHHSARDHLLQAARLFTRRGVLTDQEYLNSLLCKLLLQAAYLNCSDLDPVPEVTDYDLASIPSCQGVASKDAKCMADDAGFLLQYLACLNSNSSVTYPTLQSLIQKAETFARHCHPLAKRQKNPELPAKAVTLVSIAAGTADVKATNRMIDDFTKARSGPMVVQQAFEHEPFKPKFATYLKERQYDVVEWLSGQSVSGAARHGVVRTLPPEIRNDVEEKSLKWANKALDRLREQRYVVPFKTYPWAVFYRKSLWKEKGYEVPVNWDAFKDLARRMTKDMPSPIAFGNQQQWPALMTFDILDMRLNGFPDHKSLLAGELKWTIPSVRRVFERWKELKQFYPQNWETLTYQQGTDLLRDGAAGMYFIGGFIVSEVGDDMRRDLGVFAFPEMNEQWKTDSIDAPIDGYVLPANARHPKEAEALIAYLGTSGAFKIYNEESPGFIGIIDPDDSDDHEYKFDIQRKCAELLRTTENFAQGMERETMAPEFMENVVMPRFDRFLREPDKLDAVLQALEAGRQRYIVGRPRARW